MKHRTPSLAMMAVAVATTLVAGTWSRGQAPVADDPALHRLTADIHAQHRLLAENQTKIEERLAQLAETLRLARIYAARGGRGGGE